MRLSKEITRFCESNSHRDNVNNRVCMRASVFVFVYVWFIVKVVLFDLQAMPQHFLQSNLPEGLGSCVPPPAS